MLGRCRRQLVGVEMPKLRCELVCRTSSESGRAKAATQFAVVTNASVHVMTLEASTHKTNFRATPQH